MLFHVIPVIPMIFHVIPLQMAQSQGDKTHPPTVTCVVMRSRRDPWDHLVVAPRCERLPGHDLG
jgi:hypothetical protein